jgi:hypothetical protein
MVDLTNIGTLFAFILVCAGIIILRKKQPDLPRPFKAPGGWMWSMGLYAVSAVVVLLLPWTWPVKLVVLALGFLLFAAIRNLLFPMLGIVSCLYLIYFLPPTSWLRFAAWLNMGFAIYATYGIKHSRLTGRTPENTVAHDAYAAVVGAVLTLVGTALLLFMRALDLLMIAFKKPEALTGFHHFTAALRETFHITSWLEVSWFMLVPMALNAFILCPVVIKRILRYQQRTGEKLSARLTASLAMSMALPLLTLIYFVLVYTHGR